MSAAAQAVPGTFTPLGSGAQPQPLDGTFQPLPLNRSANPEDESASQAYAFNKGWAKSGSYATKLDPASEAKFQSWVKSNHVPWQDSPTADYDMRGYWKAHVAGKAQESRNAWDGKMHFPDTWKTPYNGAFSRESIYALPGAPEWKGNRLYTKDGRLVTDETPQNETPQPSTANVPTFEQPISGQGVYSMTSPEGTPVKISYGNVQKAAQAGWRFADDGTAQTYARDHAADPVTGDMVQQYIDKLPDWNPVKIAANALTGIGSGVTKTLAGADKLVRNDPVTRALSGGKPPRETRLEMDLQQAAATPTQGVVQGLGDVGENAGEFMTGEEILGMLGRGAGVADTLRSSQQLAGLVEKYPKLGFLLKIGANAVKQGTIAGAQGYVKTGGDTGAGAETGGETALGTLALGGLEGTGAAIGAMRRGVQEEAPEMVTRTVAGVDIPVEKNVAEAAASPTAQKSAEAYSELAKQAAKEHLDTLAVHPDLRADVLANTTDITSAAEQMKDKVLNPIYENLNTLTDGKFRALNSEVQQARLMARSGTPEAVAHLKAKTAEMDHLFDSIGGVPKNYLEGVKDAWHRQYVMEDVGDMWDRNLNGVPGASNVSAEQRGVNGNGLMRDMQRAVKKFGRAKLEQVFGADRLQAWEQIARLNQTNARRKAFNIGLREVADALPEKPRMSEWGKRSGAMILGGAASHLMGGNFYGGMVGGEAAYESTRYVMNAIRSNPAIAKNFIFALESGAAPERYGPYIAGMIVKANQQQQTGANQ